jgi:methylmalonyl-CoA mutase, N-terminal domain
VARVAAAAAGDERLMPLLREAFARRATLGEVCDALRGVWGQYR